MRIEKKKAHIELWPSLIQLWVRVSEGVGRGGGGAEVRRWEGRLRGERCARSVGAAFSFDLLRDVPKLRENAIGCNASMK